MIEAGTTIWRCFHRPHAVTARTRCLKWCLRRTGSDVTHVTCVYLLVPAVPVKLNETSGHLVRLWRLLVSMVARAG